MDGPDVPPFFICPISLQIMKDPVTISTGMTYDRESIQKWLFTYNNTTCPVTKLPLTNHSLTPNSTLLRLIQSWCINNQSKSSTKIDRRPNPTAEFAVILSNLAEEVREPKSQIKSLRTIKSLIEEHRDNMLYLEEAGVTPIVSSIIIKTDLEGIIHSRDKSVMVEEAMAVLYLLTPSSEMLRKASEDKNGRLIESLSLVMQHGNYQARIQSALILKSIFKVVDDKYKAELRVELLEGITEILKDQNSIRGSKAVLYILMEVIPFGRNLIKAVDAGVVSVLVELLAETNDKQVCEIMLGVLELLCGKAEGRSAFLAHPASLAVVASKILMVSQIANDKAVKVLALVCRFCKGYGVVQELLEVGAVAKLCMVMQAECRLKTKDKAKEILGFHLKAWIKSPCFSSCFLP